MVRPVRVSGGGGTDGLSAETTHSGGIVYQKIDATANIGSQELAPTEIKVETNRFAETARAEVTGLWDGNGTPSKGDDLTLDINGTRVFTGTVEKPSSKGDGRVSVVAFDLVKDLMRAKVTQSFEMVPLDKIVQYISNEVNSAVETDFPGGCQVSPNYENTPAVQILDQMAKWGNVIWWVDEYNTLHVSEPDSELHRLGPEFIESNPTAGEKEQPYRRVIVKGEAQASRSGGHAMPGGEEAFHMIAKNPITATAGEGEPAYRYESKQIRTQEQAERVAQSIFDEFRRQQAEGTVAIVGEGAPIRPLDAIEMPESFDNAKFLVSGIKHTITSSDGFISDINCGGLLDGT